MPKSGGRRHNRPALATIGRLLPHSCRNASRRCTPDCAIGGLSAKLFSICERMWLKCGGAPVKHVGGSSRGTPPLGRTGFEDPTAIVAPDVLLHIAHPAFPCDGVHAALPRCPAAPLPPPPRPNGARPGDPARPRRHRDDRI